MLDLMMDVLGPLKKWLRDRFAARIASDSTILGETLHGWKEVLEEVAGWAFSLVLRTAFYLAVLYGLVKFVKWAGSTEQPAVQAVGS